MNNQQDTYETALEVVAAALRLHVQDTGKRAEAAHDAEPYDAVQAATASGVMDGALESYRIVQRMLTDYRRVSA